MPHTYRTAYSIPATNLSPASLSAALAVIPRDLTLEALLGLTVAPGNDSVATAGSVVTRTITYNSAPGPLGDPSTGDALVNLYTEKFSLALSSRVVAAPVVFT